MSSAGGATIVLGVIGSDVHAVGNKILDKVFSDAGFKVVNLGVMVSHEEFISAAIETGAEAILVSSLYGQGELDCQGLREECIERGIEDIILYVGGNLVIGKTESVTIRDKFKAMGYDRVFVPSDELDEAIALLHGDIEEQRNRAGR